MCCQSPKFERIVFERELIKTHKWSIQIAFIALPWTFYKKILHWKQKFEFYEFEIVYFVRPN